MKMKKNLPLILSFLIPLCITGGICIARGMYPFGDQCMLHIDMYHQYAPFFTEFMNQLKEGGSLAYTWNLGLGTDMVSLMAYYFASPVNWLLVLCPQNTVIEFMSMVILLKISAAGLTFCYYLRSHYGDEGFMPVLFSVFYAPRYACLLLGYYVDGCGVAGSTDCSGTGAIGETEKMCVVFHYFGTGYFFELLHCHYDLHFSGDVFCNSYDGTACRTYQSDSAVWHVFSFGGGLRGSDDIAGDSTAFQ